MANKAPKSIRKGCFTTALLFVLVGGFFFANLAIVGVARAETLYSQTVYNTYREMGQDNYSYIQELGNGLSGTINEICVYGYSGTSKAQVRLYSSASDNGASPSLPYNVNFSDFPTSASEYCASTGDIELDSDLYYFLGVHWATYGDTVRFYAAIDENSYDGSSLNLNYNPCSVLGNCALTDQSRDLYFKLNGDLPNQNTLAIDYPANASTTTDFSLFKTAYNIGTFLPGPTVQYTEVICYGTSQADVGDCQNATSTWPNRDLTWSYNFQPISGAGTQYVYKPNLLNVGTTYYAKGYLYQGTYESPLATELATSPEMSFTIISGNYNSQNPYYSTSTLPTGENATSTLSANCDDVSWYFYPFCWAFLPPQDVFDTWENLGPSVKNKPPMGYLTLIQTQLNSLSSSTPAFNLPIIDSFKTYFLDPFKIGMSALLYLGLAIFLFKRFSHFEL